VQRIGHGFDESRVVPTEGVGKIVKQRLRDGDAFGKAARAVHAEQYPCSTEFNLSSQAEFAGPAGKKGIYGDSTSIFSAADKLVTHYEGRDAKAELTNAVQFTSANSGPLHVQQNLAVTDDDFGNVENFDNAGRGKNECSHRDLLRASRSYYVAHASGLARDNN
jgi:hypothetical protein